MVSKILGAGVAGLCAALNLAANGKEVTVFERRSAPGEHMHPNYQGLLHTDNDPFGYLKRLGIQAEFNNISLSKAIFCTRNREIDVKLKTPIQFILRGGPESLEHGMYKQGEAMGIDFQFNERRDRKNMDIISTGHGRSDMAAHGRLYEDLNFERDRFLYMHDDRFSPRVL